MRQGPSVFGIIIFFVILLAIDIYAFQGVKTATRGLASVRLRTIIHWAYWLVNAGLFSWMLYIAVTFTTGGPTHSFMRLGGVMMLFLVPKLVLVAFLMGEDIYRLFRMGYAGIHNAVSGEAAQMEYSESRRRFVSQLGTVVAAIPFAGILHGLTFGKFRYTVRRETLYFPDLPEAFDGFTITQVSDIHSGSFHPVSDKASIEQAVTLINEQKSDLLLFTGDLVNNRTDEMEPWADVFSKLHAPAGKFSVLGNHDYGDYVPWPSQEEKQENMRRMYEMHERIGFKLMRNENGKIERNGQTLWLLGVENWGLGPFPKHGDINRALLNVPEDGFKVLLSHDPSYWDAIIHQMRTPVHLTLSGHTHGMQFGIEIPGIKWSPIKYRYPRWAGLYEARERFLYVNRGFGFLGMPFRVGIWPEITVLTLKKGESKVA